jgi:hypothetical protein
MRRATIAISGAICGALCAAAGCRNVPALTDAPPRPVDAFVQDVTVDPDDGAPMRMPCTSSFGTALGDGEYGRLDGFLVAIVPPLSSTRPCNADEDHVHLQVQMQGEVYDIAVNVDGDVHTTTLDMPAFSAWSEGWHTDVAVSYPSLGLSASTIPLSTEDDLVNALDTDLAAVNHISVYATGYGPDGAHLVHYNGGGHDGLIVTQPLSATSHMRAFSFTSDTF